MNTLGLRSITPRNAAGPRGIPRNSYLRPQPSYGLAWRSRRWCQRRTRPREADDCGCFVYVSRKNPTR